MYLATVRRSRPAPGDPAPAPRRRTAVGGNVLALGAVSLTTDVSAEMVTAVLPLYLVTGLHLAPAAYGLLDGLYTGATVLLRLVGGFTADRIRRRKAVAAAGYGLSAAAKLGLLATGGSAALLGLVITVDRAGKGLRTAPRDALITLSVPPQALGRAFGVHRAMDAVGAFAGPLVALAVLTVAQQAFDAVFLASFCIAALGLVILALFVREHRDHLPVRGVAPVRAVSARDAVRLLHDPRLRRLFAAAVLLGLATVGDGFLYLLLQRRADLAVGWFPLLAVGTALAYLLLAGPLGALADRIGRLPVLLTGYAALAGAYLLVDGPLDGRARIVAVLALHGLFYAATDGLLMALVTPALPDRLRTTGLALVQSGQALAYLASSVAFGLAWQAWGPTTATRTAAGAVLLALVTTALLLRRPAGAPASGGDAG